MPGTIVVAVKAVIVHERKLLIAKRSIEDDIDPGMWELVGGKVDFGERLEIALEREVEEEVGLRVTVTQLLYATTFLTDPSRQVVILTYLCRPASTTVALSFEHSDAAWVTPFEAKERLHPRIVDDLTAHAVWQHI
ncbi:NUDIX domain-containing protein [Exiguobacterium sp. ZOR0005]|uniref:NUDIX hydrolase n=1 Tax=Exiguobacterium sp. ZOR0005 TaxID=1339226 RepID=UPI000428C330|nr:NUDIX domain-containing protein [Exiguobacterium sp. ZOR0005]